MRRVVSRGRRRDGATALSRSTRGVEGHEKGLGGGWRTYCRNGGARNVTFGAGNSTPYTSEVQDISFVAVGLEPKAILEWRMQWMHVRPERYFGFQEHILDKCSVRITTLERTLVDCLQEPRWGGGIETALRAWTLSHNSINLDALVDVVDQFDIGVLRQRVGFILDELGLAHPSVEAWRSMYAQRGGSSTLLASAPYAPTYSERWSLSINTTIAALRG